MRSAGYRSLLSLPLVGFFAGTTYDCVDLLLGAKILGAKKETGADTMQQYSIHKTGNQYVVRAEKDLLICESRREAEHIICDVTTEKSVSRAGPLTSLGVSHRTANSTGVAVEEPPCTNADVLAKAILDIKLMLDIEKALADDLDFGKPRNARPNSRSNIDHYRRGGRSRCRSANSRLAFAGSRQ